VGLHQPDDHALPGIVAFGIIARQTTDEAREREAAAACQRMSGEELRAAHTACWALLRQAAAHLGRAT
jgi:hypothetical protein